MPRRKREDTPPDDPRDEPPPIMDLPRFALERALRDFETGESGAARWGAREEAQELAYDALEAHTPYQSLILARQALALDPDCVDALLARAYLMPTPEERRSMYRQAIRAGERTLGPAFMEAAKGDFWGLIETRPYMRALHALADDLGSEGRFDEAVPLCERMLELNPNDNQGVRFQLFALYLATDRLDEAARLDERFPDDATAFFTWGRVLLHYLQGNEQRALQALRKARGWNPHVEAYLTGKRKLDPSDQPNYYSIGDENEAYLAAEYLLPAWVRHPDAVAWLKKQSGRAPRKP